MGDDMSSELYSNGCKLYFMRMALNERAELILNEQGINKADLSRIVKTTSMTITHWVNGPTKRMKAEHAYPITQKYGYAMPWLTLGKGPIMAGTGHPSLDYIVDAYQSDDLPEWRLPDLAAMAAHYIETGQGGSPPGKALSQPGERVGEREFTKRDTEISHQPEGK